MKWVAVSFGFACAFGQTGLTFEVASVKPSPPLAPGQVVMHQAGGPGTGDPSQIHWEFVPLSNVVQSVYGVSRYQQLAVDAKDRALLSGRYDILANVPKDATREQFNTMLRNLWIDRFKLTVHHETRSLPVYELVVAKRGLKMKETGGALAKHVEKPSEN